MLSDYIKRGALITALYAGTSAFMRCINFIFLPYFLTVLTLAEFGIWDFHQMLFVRGAIIVTSIAVHALLRFYFLHTDDPAKQHQVISNAVWLLALSTVLFLGIGYAYVNSYTNANFGMLTLLITALYGLFSFIITFLRVQEKLGWYMILFCSQNILFCAGTFIGIWHGYKLHAFFGATAASLFLFLPLFVYLLYRYHSCSFSLACQQLWYSTPLLFYGIINVSFFMVDRFFIQHFTPDQHLAGTYAILWRFGSIFQILALSLVDAWPNIIFKAHHEAPGSTLARSLINYYASFLLFASLATLACSQILFRLYMPQSSQSLCIYLPLFFISLTLYELARLLQSGLTLTKKTAPVPALGMFCLFLQLASFAWCYTYLSVIMMPHIIMCNICIFIIYGCISAYWSARTYKKVYGSQLFDKNSLMRMTALFMIACAFIQIAFKYSALFSCSISCILVALWPLSVLAFCLNSHEKEYLAAFLFGIGPQSDTAPNLGKHMYTQGVINKKVVLVGPRPPLLGGVSIHLDRVGQRLESQNNFVVYFDVNIRQKIGLMYLKHLLMLLIKEKPDIVHLHTPYNGIEEFWVVLLAKAWTHFELVFIDHNCRYLYQKSWIYKLMYNGIMYFVDRHVLIGSVSDMYRNNYVHLGANPTIESPFLPPPVEKKHVVLATYPPEFFNFCATHTPLLCANASGLVLLNNKDLYGFDSCITLISSLKKEFPRIGIVLALAAVKNSDYFTQLKTMIEQTNTKDHIFFLQGQKELWPALEYIDLFIRPTLSDGLSLSIEEAQWAGKPVIASDASMRQTGVITYPTSNQEHLHQTVHTLLASQETIKSKALQSLDHNRIAPLW